MRRSVLLSICLVAWLCQPSAAQVVLEQKLPESSSQRLDVTTKIDQTLTIAGQVVETSNGTHIVSKTTLGKRDGAGNLTAEEIIERLQASMAVMGNTYQFDSNNPDDKGTSPLEAVREIHKAAAKRIKKITYDKSNHVTKVETDFVVLGSVPDEIRNLVKDESNPEVLKTAANDELNQLKSEPVKPGDTWRRTVTMNFGSGQVMTFEIEFTYVGPVKHEGRSLEKITTKAQEVKFGLVDSPLPLQIKDCKLKPEESSGVILFDRELGQTVETESHDRVTGTMTFTINNTDLPATLDLTFNATKKLLP